MRHAIVLMDNRPIKPLLVVDLNRSTMQDIATLRAAVRDLGERVLSGYVTTDERWQLEVLEREVCELNKELRHGL